MEVDLGNGGSLTAQDFSPSGNSFALNLNDIDRDGLDTLSF